MSKCLLIPIVFYFNFCLGQDQNNVDSLQSMNAVKIVSEDLYGFINPEDSSLFTGIMYENYYGTNNIEWAVEYKDGLNKNGKVTTFHQNGSLKSTGYYGDEEGAENGAYQEWYETGELKLNGQYLNGSYHGTWKTFDKEGKVISVNEY